jgi:rhodanese-related sulfurtransferase
VAIDKKTSCAVITIILTGILLTVLCKNSLAQEPKDILSIEAYDMFNTVPDTYLIDVRTRAEFQFVGHPVGAYLFPYMFMSSNLGIMHDKDCYKFDIKNDSFIQEINKLFKKSDNLLILSRDGARSSLAAVELVKAGYKNVYNIKDGFEGPAFPSFEDDNKNIFFRQLARRNKIYGLNHRQRYGWQYWGLPWTYEIDRKYIYPPDLVSPE